MTCLYTVTLSRYNKGYEGPDCQVDVDECQSQGNVCKNGGVCKNSPGSFSCSCPFSTTGESLSTQKSDSLKYVV